MVSKNPRDGLGREPRLTLLPKPISTLSLKSSRLSYTWAGLNRACHQHAYELSPTSSELFGWLATVEELAVRVKGAGEPRHR